MFDFPASPFLQEEYIVGGITYIWNGQGWFIKGSMTGGSSPTEGYTKAETDALNDAQDAAQAAVDAAQDASINNRVLRTGDTMTGHLALPTGPAAGHAVRKDYVDAAVATRVLKTGDVMTGQLSITNGATLHLEPNSYIDILKDNPGVLGHTASIFGVYNSKRLWGLHLGDDDVNEGAESMSSFSVFRYNDAGVLYGNPAIRIKRASGDAYFGSHIIAAGDVRGYKITANNYGFEDQSSQGLWVNGYDLSAGGGGTEQVTRGVAMQNQSELFFSHIPGQVADVRIRIFGATNFQFYNSGEAFKPNGGTWAANSDARIKTVHGPYQRGLADVLKMPSPVRYSYKGNDKSPDDIAAMERSRKVEPTLTDAAQPEHIGFVAQDVETVWPEMVAKRNGWINGGEVTDFRTLDTTPLIYSLVNAIKELNAKVVALEAQLKVKK